MDTLTKILITASDLFRQYGFKIITMDDISRRAGISKKTLYQHFANKPEVVQEAIIWYKSLLMQKCRKELADSENAIEAMVRCMKVLDIAHSQSHPLIMLELERYYPESFIYLKESLLAEDVKYIYENLLSGISTGLYRKEIKADFLARYRMEISLLSFYPNLMMNNKYTLPLVSHDISEHFLYGILSEKGIRIYKENKENYLQKVSEL